MPDWGTGIGEALLSLAALGEGVLEILGREGIFSVLRYNGGLLMAGESDLVVLADTRASGFRGELIPSQDN